MWKFKSKLMFNLQFREKILRNIRKYFESMKENKNAMHQNLWNPDKEVLEMNNKAILTVVARATTGKEQAAAKALLKAMQLSKGEAIDERISIWN